ncbi:class II aldolase/adducin family protein [Teichococcus vastitatis]|uniref:Class II aldolase/adducin family protein n=1 Tax=Teichococcus vastitatis TaxID=2307076 RepID=A0ABS9W770_9PROT|nr:class II aldolase/adducin family protein [Pseudoroseomonas vastitatis]MCI0755142.1 class II aldolase/adducin family protein [Pseudoroseomonas vastitatis]
MPDRRSGAIDEAGHSVPPVSLLAPRPAAAQCLPQNTTVGHGVDRSARRRGLPAWNGQAREDNHARECSSATSHQRHAREGLTGGMAGAGRPAACYRLIAHYDMADMMANHISARVPGKGAAFLINPYGMMYEEITASLLIKVDADGRILAEPDYGDFDYGINRAGYVIHSAVHSAKHEIDCVIHTHTWPAWRFPRCNAACCRSRKLPCASCASATMIIAAWC